MSDPNRAIGEAIVLAQVADLIRGRDAARAQAERLAEALRGLDAVIHFDLPWGGGMKPREHSGGVRIGAMNAAMQRAHATLAAYDKERSTR